MKRTAVVSPIIFCPRPVFGTLPSSMGVSELDHGDANDDDDQLDDEDYDDQNDYDDDDDDVDYVFERKSKCSTGGNSEKKKT